MHTTTLVDYPVRDCDQATVPPCDRDRYRLKSLRPLQPVTAALARRLPEQRPSV